MLYVEEELLGDEKLFLVGRRLRDKDGPARVLALYLWCVKYARQHATDGFIPEAVVHGCPLVTHPVTVGRHASARDIGLLSRVRGGYQIPASVYFRFNPTADTVRRKRAEARHRKRLERLRKLVKEEQARGESDGPASRDLSHYLSQVVSQRDKGRDLIHVPVPVVRTEKPALPRRRPPFRVYAAIATAVVQAMGLESTHADLADAMKTQCAHQQVPYDTDVVARALRAASRGGGGH